MHPNPAFRNATERQNVDFLRERGFGVLSAVAGEGIVASHVPLEMHALDGPTPVLRAHLLRSTPLARAVHKGDLPALLVVSGPDGYVSPDWYGLGPGLVPTWNYVALHLRGRLRALPPEALRPHLAALSEQFETRIEGKAPWRIEKTPQDALEKMMRQLLPVELVVETIEGTWKLNQNRPEDARLRAADAMAGSPIGQENAALAALMRAVSESD
ncbi:MAG: FMN-binding negative transcriptional regulator [Neomegalonema sp.]|nr:FMN-binding negative transcriptional regulator [Neomegalonema sp.]